MKKHPLRDRNLLSALAILLLAVMPALEADTSKKDLVIDECDTPADWKGAILGAEVKEGAGAIFGVHPQGNTYPWAVYRGLDAEKRNWSDYQFLSFWIYNTDPGSRKFYVTLSSLEPSQNIDDFPYGNVPDYYFAAVDLDFEGWKKIVLPLDQFHKVREPKGMDTIGAVTFSMGHVGGPQDGIYPGLTIDDIRLTNSPEAP